MWTITNRCDEVSDRIIKVGLHAEMFKNLSWEMLSEATLAATLNESRAKRYFARAQIIILHNVARTDTARTAFRKCKAVEVVQKFRSVVDDPVIFTPRALRS